ncbi:hypothetical protein YC68_24505 [Vibrio parahaemolyticus]|nr:hypothetical protein YC68_24505 [Vibrio parahaemolyticus]
MKKWEGYSLPTFAKIGKKRHLSKFSKNHTAYSNLNADFDLAIGFLVKPAVLKINENSAVSAST